MIGQKIRLARATAQTLRATGFAFAGVAILCACLSTPGCRRNTPEEQQQLAEAAAKKKEAVRVETQKKFLATLPSVPTGVRDEGGDNVSFDLNLGGTTHRYWAYYHAQGADSNGMTFRATITRID
jgi:hypothetical protein